MKFSSTKTRKTGVRGATHLFSTQSRSPAQGRGGGRTGFRVRGSGAENGIQNIEIAIEIGIDFDRFGSVGHDIRRDAANSSAQIDRQARSHGSRAEWRTPVRHRQSTHPTAERSSFPQLPDQRIILCMGTDPEPDGGIGVEYANGAPVKPDSDRINWLARMDSFELERRMVRGSLPAGICPAGQCAHLVRQFAQTVSECFRSLRSHGRRPSPSSCLFDVQRAHSRPIQPVHAART